MPQNKFNQRSKTSLERKLKEEIGKRNWREPQNMEKAFGVHVLEELIL
jgi:hypothetical protein